MTSDPTDASGGGVGPNGASFRNPNTDDIDEFQSFRPALLKLDTDIRELEAELMDGFNSRSAIIQWTQRLCVHTLGWVGEDWFTRLAKQFRTSYADGRERTVISCLLAHDSRIRALEVEQAEEVRRQIVTQTIRPAKRIAFRQLRSDAGEYVSDASGSAEHNAAKQRYIAMRPALDELHEWQQSALDRLLTPGGFDDREDLLSWTRDLELATHGETPEDFATRCYQERATRRTLVSNGPHYDRAREFFAAAYLIPLFNRGVSDLSGRTKETAQREQTKSEPTQL